METRTMRGGISLSNFHKDAMAYGHAIRLPNGGEGVWQSGRVLAASVAASQKHRKSTSIIRVANGTRDIAERGKRKGRGRETSYDGRGQNEQLKFIDMQKFTSFWFGFCNLGKTDSVPVSVSIRAARMVELRKLLPFLGLLFLFAICLCDFLLPLSLSVYLSLCLAGYCSGLRITKGNFY